MSSTEKMGLAAEIPPELAGELQRLMEQAKVSAPDLLQRMVTVYKQNAMLQSPETSAALQQMTVLVQRLDDQYPDNHYIPTAVLLQKNQAELTAAVKKFLNTLSPGTFPPPKPPKIHGLMGYGDT
jgi:uncharacterized lipoprotein YmbA